MLLSDFIGFYYFNVCKFIPSKPDEQIVLKVRATINKSVAITLILPAWPSIFSQTDSWQQCGLPCPAVNYWVLLLYRIDQK
jgi:hypothetical protein